MIYLKKNIRQEAGATSIEYGILSALIAVVTILSLQATGTNLGTTYCTIANELSQAVGAGSTASGCSAPSSSSSSSSSADSSGADSSGSSADSSSSSADSSGSGSADSSSSSGAVDSDSNSWTSGAYLVPNAEALLNYIDSGNLTGIYDENGNELKTTEDIASYFGVQSEYDAMHDAYYGYQNGTVSASQESAASQALTDAEENITKQIYVPDPTAVTYTVNDIKMNYLSQKAGTGGGSGTTRYNYGTTKGTSYFLSFYPPTGN